MNRFTLVLSATLLAGCSPAPEASPSSVQPASVEAAAAPTTAATGESERATASGVVRSVDTAAGTVTIEHGPVPALGWPGMTMAFAAPGVDLSTLHAGDNVDFEFGLTDSGARIESITRR